MGRYTREELRGQTLHWLVSVTVRGRTWRFSQDDLSIADGSDELHFTGSLGEIDYYEAITEPGGAAESNSVSVDLVFAGEDADGWASLVRASRGIGGATAELALIRDGDAFSVREVRLDGRVDGLSYGAFSEPVAFTIEESPWEVQSPPFPPPTAAVTASTWPRVANSGTHQIGDGVEGMVYPFIFGAPGRAPGSRLFGGSPGLLVEIETANLDNSVSDAYVLVAGHRCKGDGVAAAVKLFNRTQGGGNTFQPSAVTDLLGNEVTIITVPGGSLAIDDGDELWCAWPLPASGGLIGPEGTTLRRADDVIAYLLGQSAVRHLGGAFAQIDRRLGYVLDFVHNDPGADPLDVMREILAYLPAAYRIGPEGLEVVRWPYDATHKDALTILNPDIQEIERASGPQLSPVAEVENVIEGRFSLNLRAGKLIGRTVYAPSRRSGDTDVQVNPWAAASASVYGERAGGALEMRHVADPSVAAALLDFGIQHSSQQREYVVYTAPQEYQALRPGSVLTVTDDDILWTKRLCVLLATRRGPGPTELSLVTLPSWLRDATAG